MTRFARGGMGNEDEVSLMDIDEAIVEYLKSDPSLIDMVGGDSEAAPEDAPSPRIWRRRAPQNQIKPYVIVSPPFNFDDGTSSTGSSVRKIANLTIKVFGRKTLDELEPIRNRVKFLVQGVGQRWLPNLDAEDQVFCQCLIIQDIDADDGEIKPSPSGSEAGLVHYSFLILAAWDENIGDQADIPTESAGP